MTAAQPAGMSGHDPWHELAVGHALNALEPSDEEAFAAHLLGCESCRVLVAEVTGVAADLASASEPSEPPPSLWPRIATAIAASDRPPLSAPPATPPKTPAQPVAPDRPPASTPRRPAPPPEQVPRRASEPSRRPAWLRSTALAVAAALIGIAGLSGVVLVGRFLQVRTDKAAAERQLAAVLDCAGRRDCTVVPLQPQDGGSASAVALMGANAVQLVVNNLAATDQNSTYVLWAVTPSGGATGLGTFAVGNAGRHIVAPDLEADVVPKAGPVLAVSRERGQSIPAAPSTPLLQSKAA